MNQTQTLSSERIHIGFFGMRNAGKSSLVNAITGQELSVVSDVKGTTTDPVKKSMELLPLGPVVIIDTPGLDDEGELGQARIAKTYKVLSSVDIAVLVFDSVSGFRSGDELLLKSIAEHKIPCLIVCTKEELPDEKEKQELAALLQKKEVPFCFVSAAKNTGISELKNILGSLSPKKEERHIISDLLSEGELVLLVTPIDEAAPKGRLILPQQMVLRDILDAHAIAVTCQDTEVARTLSLLSKKPKMVITDSQVFSSVSKDVPGDIPLTSFSILMARYKGELKNLVKGASILSDLQNGDNVLISEGCTHHRQCNDIGTVKLPHWIKKHCHTNPNFSFTSGSDFPEDLSGYSLIIHCGGCMLKDTEMAHRAQKAAKAGVPIVNYGIAIAAMNGILERSLELFP